MEMMLFGSTLMLVGVLLMISHELAKIREILRKWPSARDEEAV